MRKRLLVFLGVLILLTLTVTSAWAQGTTDPLQQEANPPQDVLWTTLAPLLAIAAFVERVLEVFWDRWEKKGSWPHRRGVADTSSAEYISKKRLASHLIGMLLAFLAVGLTNVRFFRLLGLEVLFSNPSLVLFNAGIGGILDNFTVGTLIDWLMTAAVVGWGGTEITHSIIEGMVKGRNLWKEMREVQAGQKSVLDAEFFTEYVAPALEKRGISVARMREAFEMLGGFDLSVDQVLGTLTVGQMDQLLSTLEAQPENAAAGRVLRDLLEGVPPEQAAEIPNILALLTPEQRRRFLGG